MPRKITLAIFKLPVASRSTPNLWGLRVGLKCRSYFRSLHRAGRAGSDRRMRHRRSRRSSGRQDRRSGLLDRKSTNKSVTQRPSILHGRRFILKEQVTLQGRKIKSPGQLKTQRSTSNMKLVQTAVHRNKNDNNNTNWIRSYNIPTRNILRKRWN